MILPVKRTRPDTWLPRRMTGGAAGLDLYAPDAFCLKPGEVRAVDTGLAVAIPAGHVGRIHGRSSLERRGAHCLAGLIDADYRGPLGVVFTNVGADDVWVNRGDRMCQLVVQPVAACDVTEVSDLPATGRGEGGWGSTGA